MDKRPETQPTPDGTDLATDPRTVLRGTEQLLATIPYLLGYQPGRSVVVMASAVREADDDGSPPERPCGTLRASVRVTARFDVPAEDDADAAVGTLAIPLARAAREADDPLLLHAFVYDADDAAATAVAAAIAALADEGGHRLHDLVLVREDRYLAIVAEGSEETDPTAGWREVMSPADVPGVADLVLEGRFPAGSRDDVAARVRRRDEKAAAATALALRLLAMAPETYDPLEALGRLGRWVVDGEGEPAPRDRARIVVLLSDRTLRDAVMARWLPQLFTVEEVLPAAMAADVRRTVPPWPVRDAGALDRLIGLAAGVPEEHSVPVLTLVAAVGWGTGEGTIANEAVDRALELDPDYAMAALIRSALDKGLPPRLPRADVA